MFHNKSFIATFLLILAATIQGHRSKTMHQRSHSSQAVGLDLNPVDKESMCNTGDAGDPGLIPVSERSLRGRHSNPLQYSCLQNSMDRGAWQATVHSVTKSQTQLKRLNAHTQSWNAKSVSITSKLMASNPERNVGQIKVDGKIEASKSSWPGTT